MTNAKALIESYMQHANTCILSFWEGGEPTADGGYRQKFKGVWYQVRPIEATPKCNCGLDGAIEALEALTEKS